MQLLDSRRLTGLNLLLDRAGAVIEVSLAPEEADAAIAAWRAEAGKLLAALGWEGEVTAERRHPGGASLALSAPIDVLYTATEVAEAAWAAVAGGGAAASPPSFAETVERLAEAAHREENQALRRLALAAERRGAQLLWDDELVTVGSGTGSHTWPAHDLPEPGEVDWAAVHDVPIFLVTGTNGKTTTVRLLAALIAAAGRTPGMTSTDRVCVGSEVLELGDFSGPGGARTLLRDRRVEMAVLETARGGLLRRGLAVQSAAAALVTNVAADHLGEYGIGDLAALAEAKLLITHVVPSEGSVVLNADDPELVLRGTEPGRFRAPIVWFGLDPEVPHLASHLAAGGEAALLEGDVLVLYGGGERIEVARSRDVPLAFGGTARYNLANALAALALGRAAGLPVAALAEGLRRFSAADNPGRALVREIDGATLLLDYAHNPHGVAALLDFARSLPAARRLIVLGQAGDRNEEAIRELARTAWSFRPDRVVIKELPEMLRGRTLGEVPAILADELARLGAAAEDVVETPGEVEAVQAALAWARPGDLLVLLVHTQRDEVMELLAAR